MEILILVSRSEWFGLVVILLVCFGIAVLGSLVTRPEIGAWYIGIHKPSWTPPAWLFGPVWTALYTAMAVSAWTVWRRAGWQEGSLALALFVFQLLLNCLWSFIFFKYHRLGWAFADISILWIAIAATIVAFSGISQLAALLLAPYLAWVSFAAALNLAIWRMNE